MNFFPPSSLRFSILMIFALTALNYNAAFQAQAQAQEVEMAPAMQVSMPDEIRFARTISMEDLEKHLTVLASDEFEGRETGKEGQRKAAQYIADHFKTIGVAPGGNENSYFQTVPLATRTWNEPVVTIDDKSYNFLKDFYCFSRTARSSKLETNEVMFLGYGIDDPKYSDYAGQDVAGKVVLILPGEPEKNDGTYLISEEFGPSEWSTNWRKKVNLAKRRGVKTLLMVSKSVERDVKMFGNYISSSSMQLSSAGPGDMNTIYISEAMANRLLGNKRKKSVERLGMKIDRKHKTIKLNSQTDLNIDLKQNEEVVESSNVLGFIKGSEFSDEIIVITAHYDHLGVKGEKIFNGADDDGSGTVTIMEIAEAFALAAKDGNGPRRSVLIMAVSGEEKGLLGSKYYTDEDPIYPLANTVANLNVDMVGRIGENYTHGNYVHCIGADKLSTELHEINEEMNAKYTNLKLDYRYNDEKDPNRFYYRSDHYNFAKNNIPVIFYFNGSHKDYHKETDTVEKIEFESLQKRAQLVFHTAWELANRDKRIVVDKAPTK